MSNTITIINELSEKDRDILEGLSKLLVDLINRMTPTLPGPAPAPVEQDEPVAAPAKEETPDKAEQLGMFDPIESFAQHAEMKHEPKPTITLEQIQQKVVQLCAGFEGTKKAAVREIVNAYAKRVSDLPEDKWGEVWTKLTALEG